MTGFQFSVFKKQYFCNGPNFWDRQLWTVQITLLLEVVQSDLCLDCLPFSLYLLQEFRYCQRYLFRVLGSLQQYS